jgi:uncharacterized protein YbjT (DUF2867 family)
VNEHHETKPLVLLTGASGYVGGRLLTLLESAGYPVRCLVRHPPAFSRAIGPRTEVVRGDVLVPESLEACLRGVHTAFYLIHSMGSASDFEGQDRRSARNFGLAARRAGVRRIIYLGGLAPPDEDLSPHLKSRLEVGQVLRESGVQIIELRASIILGSGSLSFEMVRALVDRLPVLITPKWVRVQAQPIAIRDVLQYLMGALTFHGEESMVFEIGGADRVSYRDIMKEYARQRGLRRLWIPVPVLTPNRSSLWLGLVTPIYARVGKKLIDGIRHPTVIRDDSARRVFSVKPKGLPEAVAEALKNEEQEFAETRWSDAISSSGTMPSYGGIRLGNRLLDHRAKLVSSPPAAAFTPIRRIGGETGWYYANWLWHVRGFLDLLVGGVGVRRGRRDPEIPRAGDTLDFWRVESYEPDKRLRLVAEMKVPGRAWLEFQVDPEGTGSRIQQIAIFEPRGLFGLAYWYALYPLHSIVFTGMIQGIADAIPEAWDRITSLKKEIATKHE